MSIHQPTTQQNKFMQRQWDEWRALIEWGKDHGLIVLPKPRPECVAAKPPRVIGVDWADPSGDKTVKCTFNGSGEVVSMAEEAGACVVEEQAQTQEPEEGQP